MPTTGFFPRPDIAAQSLALSSRFLAVCPPLPPDERLSSVKCAPAECSADARTHIPKGTFLGFHTGWIVKSGENVEGTTYSVHIHHKSCTQVIRCWDTHVSSSMRADIFPLSHINEYIWYSEGSTNPNNTGSSITGTVSSRRNIKRGHEITLGYGLYEYDWSSYKHNLLLRACDIVRTLGSHQGREDISTWALEAAASIQQVNYVHIPQRHESLRALCLIVDGLHTDPPSGSVLAKSLSISAFVAQLSGVPEFSSSVSFRVADHPQHRQPVDWTGLIDKELAYLHSLSSLRRSSRRNPPAPCSLSTHTSAPQDLSPSSPVVSSSPLLFPVFRSPAPGLPTASTASGDTTAPASAGPAIVSGPPNRAPSQTDPTISAEHVSAHDDESEDSESDGDDAIDIRADLRNLSSLSTTLELHGHSEIRVAWCNINGCDDSGTLERVITLMRMHRLDLLCLTDARVTTPAYAEFLRSSALQQLGSGASIEFFLTKPGRDGDHQNIGGQIILKSPRILGPHRRFQDPSGLGVVAGLDFHIGDTDIRVMSTYWPGSKKTDPGYAAPGSLWSKLEVFLDSQKHFIDPLSYIQEYISSKLEEHLQLPQSATLVGGDFNALRTVRSPGRGVHAPIEDWARQTGQLHVFDLLDLPTIPTY